MILNTSQLAKLKQYYAHIKAGKNNTQACALVSVAPSTMFGWKNAENAPPKPVVAAKPAAKPVAKKPAPKAVAKPAAKKPAPAKKPVSKPAATLKSVPKLVLGDSAEDVLKRLSNLLVSTFDFISAEDLGPDDTTLSDVNILDDEDDIETLRVAINTEFGLPEDTDLGLCDDESLADIVEQIRQALDTKAKSDTKAAVAAEPKDELVDVKSIVLPTTLTIVRDNRPLTIDKTHRNFANIEKILSNQVNGKLYASDLQKVFDLIDMKTAINRWSNGKVEVTDKGVMVEGKPLHGKLSELLMKSLENGNEADLKRFSAFHTKIMEAISFKITTRLFEFVGRSGLGIDEDGDILAVKVIRNDWMDKHSGTISNKVGTTPQVKRNQVDDNEDNTCSNGLHVASPAYIGHFGSQAGGDRVILVKVDPRDFVAIPKDYSATKARVCKYHVVREITDQAELTKIWEAAKTIRSH